MATETTRNKTKICALDLDKELLEFLSERFDVYDGSLGDNIDVAKINNNGLCLLPTLDVPDNLQEYEVFIEDMYHEKTIKYAKDSHIHKYNIGTSEKYIISHSPQTVANLYCVGSYLLGQRIKRSRKRPAIMIVFQNARQDIEYLIQDSRYSYSREEMKCSNCEHIAYFHGQELHGSEVKLADNIYSASLFGLFLNDVQYFQTFYTPTKRINGKDVEDERFLPLLLNRQGDVISYIWHSDKDITIILPQTERKQKLLDKVFNEILFKFFSDYFPEVEENVWIKNGQYSLPGYAELLEKKDEIVAKYEAEMQKIQEQIEDNNRKYEFLHTILTATGDELVQAMINYLKWLGFENVIDKDTTQEEGAPLEEDIQVDLGEDGLLVIEVKGIGGTSTDAQCSQIHKIVYRRAKDRGAFDVHGLYIANNELHKEPLKRTRPPFTSEQIMDAENDERGLAFTWQFFNLFFAVEDGIISKEEARKALFENGLVHFIPKVIEIGVPYRYYQDHTVACIEVGNDTIKEGDFFFYNESDRWKKVQILSIQEDKNKVKTATAGRFGFGLEHRVPNNTPLYIKQE